jgi:hypothetical protein
MFQTLFTGFVGGVFAWIFTEFVAKPLLRFSELRREVTRCLVVYGNVGGRTEVDKAGKPKTLKLSAKEVARLVEAQNAFRDLSGKMYGFASVDAFANRIVTKFGYDADQIAAALMGFSNEITSKGEGRAHFRNRIEKLLRLHSVSGAK